MIKLILYDTGQKYTYEYDPDNPPDWIIRHHPFSVVLPENTKKEVTQPILLENKSE